MSDYALESHRRAANTIRGLSMDAVQTANSGHPGMPMGMADVAVVLWSQFYRHNPQDPQWPDRDRFVLSAGHGSMLIYSLLHLSGYAEMTLEELKNFRQWGSKTPGHPENFVTTGVETTTGPLGQGISNAVGMALAERWLAARFNKPDFQLVDHYTYVIASDGDLMEGISHEIGALAAHLQLGKLIVLFDDNSITIDGSTDLSTSEDVMARFAAYGWQTQHVDGHDPQAVLAAITAAREESTRPSIIACRTHIGYGSPHKQDTASAHGSPLGWDEIKLTKENLEWPTEPLFYVADGVQEFMRPERTPYDKWQALREAYAAAYPEEAALFTQFLNGDLPTNWDEILPDFAPGKGMATRASSGQVLNALAPHVPFLLGGSADLTGSNKTDLKGEANISGTDFSGRYLRFGIREHGMGGIMNGMALHGGVRPYGGTFLVFSDYMRPTIRLAALMKLPVIYVFTHDSIGLGEDGPTHQPVEHLAALRAIPNLTLIRPADAAETAMAWRAALENRSGPTALVLTRQGVPTYDRTQLGAVDGARRGAYVLSDVPDADTILIGTGSEVTLAMEAQQSLAARGVAARVVSMPSWELFAAQDAAYRESVLPPAMKRRVAVEAGVSFGWERYLGDGGMMIGLNRYGASAPYELIYEKRGITADAIVEAVLKL